jgi:putative copper resistance protein D
VPVAFPISASWLRGARTVQWLVRSALVEIVLGLGVIVIVGMIGITAPATDMAVHIH